MSKGGNSSGLSKLAALFKETAKGAIPTNPPLELGTINDDYSLTTDSFPVPIPMGDYLVCRHLKQRTTEEWTLNKDDRVLVAWAKNDAVVIDVIIQAKEVFK